MTVTIYRTPLSYRLKVTQSGYLAEHPDFSIAKYIDKFAEYTFDKRSRRYLRTKRYVFYNLVTHMLYIPGYDLESFTVFLGLNRLPFVIVDLPLCEGALVDIPMSPDFRPRDKLQEDAIDYLANSDKPLRGLALQTGCLSGNSIINFNRANKGFSLDIKTAYELFNGIHPKLNRKWVKSIPTYVRSFNGNTIQLNRIKNILYSGIKEICRVTLSNGQYIDCTYDHRILTTTGWIPANSLLDALVMCDTKNANGLGRRGNYNKHKDKHFSVTSYHPYGRQYQNPKWRCYRIAFHRAVYEAHLNNMTLNEYRLALNDPKLIDRMIFLDPSIYTVHHKDNDHDNNDPNNLEHMTHLEHRKHHSVEDKFNFGQGIPEFIKVVNIKYIGKSDTYDIECEAPHHNFVANGIVVHNSGKTASTIKALSLVGRRSIICVNGLLDQWESSIKRFTLLKDEDIYLIQGIDSVAKLLTGIGRRYNPKIILCSLGTIRAYCNDQISYSKFPPFEEFCNLLNIGVRVIDETHLEFHVNMMLDLRMNVAITMALTATFGREQKDAKHIFNNHYPTNIRHGEGEYHRYVDINAYSYCTGYGDIPSKAYKGLHGYSHSKFEAWLLKPQNMTKLLFIYKNVYRPIVESDYINIRRTGQKLLVLCSSVDMCKWLQSRLAIDYPDLFSSIYIYETDDAILDTADIIVSTPGSAGTGRDIKDLRSVLATIATGASNLNKQMLGRLRVLTNGDVPVFSYVWNTEIGPQSKYHTIRKDIFTQLGKTYNEIKL